MNRTSSRAGSYPLHSGDCPAVSPPDLDERRIGSGGPTMSNRDTCRAGRRGRRCDSGSGHRAWCSRRTSPCGRHTACRAPVYSSSGPSRALVVDHHVAPIGQTDVRDTAAEDADHHIIGSTTVSVKNAAIAASTALPPAASISALAADASGSLVTTSRPYRLPVASRTGKSCPRGRASRSRAWPVLSCDVPAACAAPRGRTITGSVCVSTGAGQLTRGKVWPNRN
jgi:hypothetical protein